MPPDNTAAALARTRLTIAPTEATSRRNDTASMHNGLGVTGRAAGPSLGMGAVYWSIPSLR